MRSPTKLALAAAGALMLAPAAAQAATKDVYAGTPPKGGMPGVQGPAIDNAFYPKRIAIHAGDRLRVRFLGFHNALFAPRGTTPPSLFVPDAQTPVAGVKDAAGADMWFNGAPSIGVNPQVVAPVGGKVINGKKLVGSGIALDGPPKPFTARFPKKGTYTLLCSIHPGMKLRVSVKGHGARVPSARQDAKRVRKQAKSAAKLATRLLAGEGAPTTGNTILAGNDRGTVATIAYFPAEKTVKVGDTVTWEMSPRTTEIHNVALGPEPYIQDLARNLIGPAGVDPMTVYPSQPPTTPLVHDGTSHGNGYVNSGVMDPASPLLPDRASITFTKPGTYTYYCVIHGAEMKGTITVTP